jgi:hypothetical protein
MSRVCGVVLLCGIVVIAPGCQRRTQYVVQRSDSTATSAADSATVRLRDAQQMWESGSDPGAAAGLSAAALRADLRPLEASAWQRRASFLLDSLGVGAEFAEARCALIVNLFSRSDPEGGSWPFLFWCGAGGAEFQPIEGRDLHLGGAVSRGLGPRAPGADTVRIVAALFSRRGPSGQAPLAMTWTLPKATARWNLAQTLGPDSLGGSGSGDFEASGDTAIALVTRTYRTPPGFQECATCPHAYAIHRFRLGPSGFLRVEDQDVPSTYSTFVRFVRSLVAGDHLQAQELVTDANVVNDALRFEWHLGKGVWRTAPGTGDESPLKLVFFRGQQEAYAVHFQQRGADWLISGFEPVQRAVE